MELLHKKWLYNELHHRHYSRPNTDNTQSLIYCFGDKKVNLTGRCNSPKSLCSFSHIFSAFEGQALSLERLSISAQLDFEDVKKVPWE